MVAITPSSWCAWLRSWAWTCANPIACRQPTHNRRPSAPANF